MIFYMNRGRLGRLGVSKPCLTPEHIANILAFAEKWIQLLEGSDKVYYAFLDEKWFYITSR